VFLSLGITTEKINFVPNDARLSILYLVDIIHYYSDIQSFYFGITFLTIFLRTDETNLSIFYTDFAFDSKSNMQVTLYSLDLVHTTSISFFFFLKIYPKYEDQS
jgi:hypothetical protein